MPNGSAAGISLHNIERGRFLATSSLSLFSVAYYQLMPNCLVVKGERV